MPWCEKFFLCQFEQRWSLVCFICYPFAMYICRWELSSWHQNVATVFIKYFCKFIICWIAVLWCYIVPVWSCDSSVGTLAGRPGVRILVGVTNFLFTKTSRRALGPTLRPTEWLGHVHTHLYQAPKFRMTGAILLLPPPSKSSWRRQGQLYL